MPQSCPTRKLRSSALKTPLATGHWNLPRWKGAHSAARRRSAPGCAKSAAARVPLVRLSRILRKHEHGHSRKRSSSTKNLVETELSRTGGLLRLAPTGSSSFLQPVCASNCIRTTPTRMARTGAASTNAGLRLRRKPPTKDVFPTKLEYCVIGRQRLTLRKRSRTAGRLSSAKTSGRNTDVGRCTRSSSTHGPIPLHMHQNARQAKLGGQEGKPES